MFFNFHRRAATSWGNIIKFSNDKVEKPPINTYEIAPFVFVSWKTLHYRRSLVGPMLAY